MDENPARALLERLRAIDWNNDSSAFDHVHSRALLAREYLRRAALWAQPYEAEKSWPFFDIAEHVDAKVRTPPGIAAELEEILKELAPSSLRTTCRGAVRWEFLRDARSDLPADLPDPYEPLLLMYERGGGYYLEEYLDLNGVMIRLGNVEANASVTPFLTLLPGTLDALDGEGETMYYAKVNDGFTRHRPAGIVRRRINGDQEFDEAFTRNLCWMPVEGPGLREVGPRGVGYVRIAEVEAAAYIEYATEEMKDSI